jgi:hypothetical protein
MGKLYIMPPPDFPDAEQSLSKPAELEQEPVPDLSVWKSAPRERTQEYFPVYSQISRAMQGAMRGWVRAWFHANPEVLLRPHSAYPFLVYICTRPFYGRPTNVFTYDIQRDDMLVRAYRSAASRLKGELDLLNTRSYDWFTRQHYFAYRSKHVVEYVSKNQRSIYRMFNIETELMDAILKFTQIDIPSMKFDDALAELKRTFRLKLRRFSKEVDLSEHADELLRIATNVLLTSEAECSFLPLVA